MATSKHTTSSSRQLSESAVLAVKISPKQQSVLAWYSRISGTPIADQVREALDDFIRCSIEARSARILSAHNPLVRSGPEPLFS